jgi:serine/threonine-protein kinase
VPAAKPLPSSVPDVPAADVRAELDKILAAQSFANSGRQSRFLRFVVEQTIEGRGPQLKEYLIGVEVYDRGEGYDPRVDTIVRVEASRLRSRLAEYYKTEGQGDCGRIDLPRGSYVPAFETSCVFKAPASLRRRPLARAGVAVVVLLALGIWLSRRIHPAEASLGAPSIAVLPFADLSAEKNQEYFCDGMTEELIGALTRIEGLRVAARTSSFEFKGQAGDVRAIGEKLHVGHVLEGSVRKDGGRLRISAQLIKASDGYHIWSETYDRDLKDVFAVQEQISRAIVENLKLKLAVHAPTQPRSENLEAYNLFFQGRFFSSKFTPAGQYKAIELFQQAIAADPKSAQPYAGIADSYLILGFAGAVKTSEALPKAITAANRALELDPTLSDPHVSIGAIQALYHWNWAESEREFQRAAELCNSSPSAHTYYALLCLTPRGRFDEALREARLGAQVDPLSREATSAVGLVHYYRREYDQAITALRKTIEIDASFVEAHAELASVYEVAGRLPEALAEAKKLEGLGAAERGESHVARIHARMGQSEEARRILAAGCPGVTPVGCSATQLLLNNPDKAIADLERAIPAHDNHLIWLGVDPMFDPLKNDPRFVAILKQINLR